MNLLCHFALGRKQLKRGGVYNWWARALFVYRVPFPITKEPTTAWSTNSLFAPSPVLTDRTIFNIKRVTGKVYLQGDVWRHKRKRDWGRSRTLGGSWEGVKPWMAMEDWKKISEVGRRSGHLSHWDVNAIAFSGLALLPSLASKPIAISAAKDRKAFHSYEIVKYTNNVPITSAVHLFSVSFFREKTNATAWEHTESWVVLQIGKTRTANRRFS